MLKYFFDGPDNLDIAVVGSLTQVLQAQLAELFLLKELLHYYYTMLQYFLEQRQPQGYQKNKRIIKQTIIKPRQYHPFHLDCPHSRKKICYCSGHPISALSAENKRLLW